MTWKPHYGEEMPVSPQTFVVIRTRSGNESEPQWRTMASYWDWVWDENRKADPTGDGDIVEYKVIST